MSAQNIEVVYPNITDNLVVRLDSELIRAYAVIVCHICDPRN